MYLAGRLCKFDIQEWTAKQSSRRWWEQFVQDVPVELLEGTPLEAITLPAFSLSFQTCRNKKNMSLSSRHLPPDPGPVLPGEQAHPSADAREGAGCCSSSPRSSSPTGTTTSHQPSSSTTKEDFPSGGQPCTPAQTLACECMLKLYCLWPKTMISVESISFFQLAHVIHTPTHQYKIPQSKEYFFLFQTSPKDEPKAPGKTFVKTSNRQNSAHVRFKAVEILWTSVHLMKYLQEKFAKWTDMNLDDVLAGISIFLAGFRIVWMFKTAAKFHNAFSTALFNLQNNLDQRFLDSRAPCPLCPHRSLPQVRVT